MGVFFTYKVCHAGTIRVELVCQDQILSSHIKLSFYKFRFFPKKIKFYLNNIFSGEGIVCAIRKLFRAIKDCFFSIFLSIFQNIAKKY